jgi:hypothetical protein
MHLGDGQPAKASLAAVVVAKNEGVNILSMKGCADLSGGGLQNARQLKLIDWTVVSQAPGI